MSRRVRRFGIRAAFSAAVACIFLIVSSETDSSAQQRGPENVLQTPQVAALAPKPAAVPPAPVAPTDPNRHLRLPVTVLDGSGHCVQWLSAGDFALRVDGDERAVEFVQRDSKSAAALGILVDISESMEPAVRSWTRPPKLAQVRSAVKMLLMALQAKDSVFLATFARRFHLLESFTTDHSTIDERIPMVRRADQLDDLDATSLYESIIKGVMVLMHAPASCDRKALVVLTDGDDTTSRHGVEDAIAKAQFAGVVIYNILVTSPRDFDPTNPFDMTSARQGLGRVAAETGGASYVVNWRGDREVLASVTQAITSELDSQYILGFAVSPWSGPELSIELMLKDHPGLRPRAPRVVRYRPDQDTQEVRAPYTGPPLPE